jgi:hypothetical protein
LEHLSQEELFIWKYAQCIWYWNKKKTVIWQKSLYWYWNIEEI